MSVSGEFTKLIYAEEVREGETIRMTIDANLYTDDLWIRLLPGGWSGQIIVTGNGRRETATFQGWGAEIGPETAGFNFNLGTMGKNPATFQIELYYLAKFTWEGPVTTESITIYPLGTHCTPGETVCDGPDLYKCRADGSGWYLFQANSSVCANGNGNGNGNDEPGAEVPWMWIAIGAGVIGAIALFMPPKKRKKRR